MPTPVFNLHVFYINPGDELYLVRQLVSVVNPPDEVTGIQSHFYPLVCGSNKPFYTVFTVS
jgi:hypothetical protein